MFMITYKVIKIEGVEGTYEDLKEAQAKLDKLQKRYIGTQFKIRKMKKNNIYKHTKGVEIYDSSKDN